MGQRDEAGDVRGHLRATLPGYMLPRYIGVVSALPRTSAGQVVSAGLPPPSPGAGAVPDAYVAPRTRTEGEVVRRPAAAPAHDLDPILDALAGLGDEQVRRAIGTRHDRSHG